MVTEIGKNVIIRKSFQRETLNRGMSVNQPYFRFSGALSSWSFLLVLRFCCCNSHLAEDQINTWHTHGREGTRY